MKINQTINIRPTQKSDRAFILSLAPRFNVGIPPWRTPEQMLDFNQRETKQAMNSISTDSIILVAENIQGERLGFISITNSTDYFTHAPQCYISAIATTEEAQGKGVGHALMDAAENWARSRSYTILSLEVFAQNERARSLYKQLGYKEETLKLIKEL